jgi:hypothetical protein
MSLLTISGGALVFPLLAVLFVPAGPISLLTVGPGSHGHHGAWSEAAPAGLSTLGSEELITPTSVGVVRIGMSKQEVIRLIGLPDVDCGPSECAWSSEYAIEYTSGKYANCSFGMSNSERVQEIVVRSSHFVTTAGVRVKDSYTELKLAYGSALFKTACQSCCGWEWDFRYVHGVDGGGLLFADFDLYGTERPNTIVSIIVADRAKLGGFKKCAP